MNEPSARSTIRLGKGEENTLDASFPPWCRSLNTFSPGSQSVTTGIGEDVNNGWTGCVTMDSKAILKDATLSSDWSCKAISNLFVLDIV